MKASLEIERKKCLILFSLKAFSSTPKCDQNKCFEIEDLYEKYFYRKTSFNVVCLFLQEIKMHD